MTLTWQVRSAGGGQVLRLNENSWRLEIPAGLAGSYRLAQLDDSTGLSRAQFIHGEPFGFRSDRVLHRRDEIPGTWGFGFWNDPFGLGLGQGGGLRLPALPNAAWFFHSSEANYLSLRDDRPAHGFLAQVFSSPPAWPFLPFAPGLVLLFWPAGRGCCDAWDGSLCAKTALVLVQDVTEWHSYRIACTTGRTRFEVDGRMVLETGVVPRGRLGLVLWIDNQFAAYQPDGKYRCRDANKSLPGLD